MQRDIFLLGTGQTRFGEFWDRSLRDLMEEATGRAMDASGLTSLDVPGQYKLSVVLRNHGRAQVMLPYLELTLTDEQGQLVSRRALAPAELGARQQGLASGAELPLQMAFGVGDQRVVGYTVEIFYP